MKKQQIIPNEEQIIQSGEKHPKTDYPKCWKTQTTDHPKWWQTDNKITKTQKQITPYEEKYKDLQNSLLFCFHF